MNGELPGTWENADSEGGEFSEFSEEQRVAMERMKELAESQGLPVVHHAQAIIDRTELQSLKTSSPEAPAWTCVKCSYQNVGSVCTHCGIPRMEIVSTEAGRRMIQVADEMAQSYNRVIDNLKGSVDNLARIRRELIELGVELLDTVRHDFGGTEDDFVERYGKLEERLRTHQDGG